MKFVALAAVCLGLGFAAHAADAARPDAKPDPETAWAEILKESRPPSPPAEWANAKPTPEQTEAWKKKLADMAEGVANKAQKFYETFPSHAKADEARNREKGFRRQASVLRGVEESPKDPSNTAETKPDRVLPQDPKVDPAFTKRMDEVMLGVRARQQKEGPMGAIDELDKVGRILTKEFPKEIEPWKMLYTAAMYSPGPKGMDIYRYMAENGPPQIKEVAQPELKRFESMNKPFKLAFKSADGAPIDVEKSKGKVVLIDFWATWCGPCIASLPELIGVYEKFHDKGLEVIGISFDEDCDEMKRFVKKNKMPWPQFCDGGKYDNALNKEFGVRAIPTMYLIDKKGILRDIWARENLADKIEALLKE